MLLFAEKVILAAIVPLGVLLIVNPMTFDPHQRISGAIALLAIGYFVAHTLQKRTQENNHPKKVEQHAPVSGVPVQQAPTDHAAAVTSPTSEATKHKSSVVPPTHIQQHSEDRNSPNTVIFGDNNTVTNVAPSLWDIDSAQAGVLKQCVSRFAPQRVDLSATSLENHPLLFKLQRVLIDAGWNAELGTAQLITAEPIVGMSVWLPNDAASDASAKALVTG